ncbi:cupin domain-containing protein [Variovorax sp. J2P1-59]|uniref:cupin domain-containing protein n=1 Tax=Variovorax flavidus TaxID=3053501 RepID=UPI002575BB44|nr:cupin domain-containing protein [Variovorax sp. J2P1-59]MDM0078595.1 cupin domain-containing protein [Variovorax sp. J2P1-59]
MFELSVPPGSNVPPPHSHTKNDECIYLLEGTLRYSVNAEVRDLTAGESMFSPRGSVHQFSNPFDAEVRALIVQSPDKWPSSRQASRCLVARDRRLRPGAELRRRLTTTHPWARRANSRGRSQWQASLLRAVLRGRRQAGSSVGASDFRSRRRHHTRDCGANLRNSDSSPAGLLSSLRRGWLRSRSRERLVLQAACIETAQQSHCI